MVTVAENDTDLSRRAGEGDAHALGELYSCHVQGVRAYLLRRTGDVALSEDLAQLTFLEAWRVLARRRLEGTSARPFLLGIATNLLRHHWRARRRHSDALERLRGVTTHGAAPDDDEAVARVDAQRRVQACLRELKALPVGELHVVALLAWEGLTYEETAAALGIPVGTVRSRMFRARRRLESNVPVLTDLTLGGIEA